MTHERLFLSTLIDLRKKVTSNKAYECIRAAGLLRHLLLDGSNLLSLANKNYKLKIKFKINSSQITPDGFAQFIPIDIYKQGSVEKNLDTFLKTEILRVANSRYTIHQIIDVVSHIKGGIHSGLPKTIDEDILHSLEKYIIMHERLEVEIIQSISKVVLLALKPLAHAIRGRTPAGGF